MNKLLSLLLVTGISFSANVSHAGEMTKASVQALISQMDKAIISHDISTIDSLISPNVNISSAVSVNGATQRMRLNKTEYLNALRQTWAQTSDYNYQRKDEQIEIVSEKATVKATVVEKMRVGGNRMSSIMYESAVIETINGKLQITKVTGNGSISQ